MRVVKLRAAPFRSPPAVAVFVFLLTGAPLAWLVWQLGQGAQRRDKERMGELVTRIRKSLLTDSMERQTMVKNWAARLDAAPAVDAKAWAAVFLVEGRARIGRLHNVGYAIRGKNGSAIVRFLEGDGGNAVPGPGVDLASVPQIARHLQQTTGAPPNRLASIGPFIWPGGGKLILLTINSANGEGVLFAICAPEDFLSPVSLHYSRRDAVGHTTNNLVQQEFLPGVGEGLVLIESLDVETWDRLHLAPDRPFMFKLLGPLGDLNLVFRPGPGFARDSLAHEALLAAGGGLIVAFLLALLAWMQARQRGVLDQKVQLQTAELREANQALIRFQSIAETTSDLVSMCELDGTPLYLNPAGRALLGIPAGEDSHLHEFSMIYTPEAMEIIRREGIPHAMEAGPWSTELNLLHQDGRSIPVSFVGFVIKSPQGQPIHMGSMARDITARRQLDLQLRESLEDQRELVRVKSQFVNIVSHEFRTPLGVILSSADILTHYLDRLPAATRQEHLQDIHDSSKQMARMLDQVLDLGRIEAGQKAANLQPLDLPSLLRRIVDESRSATGGREILLTLTTDLTGACGDESLMRHILFNVLSNARKYSAPDAPVAFTVRRDDGDAVFSVEDHGIGIPEADLPHLFEAFSRASNVGDAPGTGLGLAIVKRGLDLHGGTIQVRSEEGTGTTVTMRLPLFPHPSI